MLEQNEKKEQCKKYLREYLESKGLNLSRNITCINPKHDDKTPSMHLTEDNLALFCFGCHATYDIYNAVEILENLKPGDAFQYVYKRYATTPAPTPKRYQEEKEISYKSYFARVSNNLDQFLADQESYRGIPLEVLRRAGTGYDPDWKSPKAPKAPTTPRLIIPTSEFSYIARDIRPDEDLDENARRYKKQKTGPVHIYDVESVKENQKSPVFLTEGELDALSIIALGYNAIATGGAANVNKITEYLKGYNGTVILSLDNDDTGEQANKKIQEALDKQGIVSYIPNGLYQSYKDANEYLQKDPDGLRNQLQKAIDLEIAERDKYYDRMQNYYSQYSAKTIAFSLDDIIANTPPPIPTKLDNLDKILDGGLYSGLYILGANTGAGKTSLLLQIADNIAAYSDRDILYISLEMGRHELIARSLSRLTYTLGEDTKVAMTARQILNPQFNKDAFQIDKLKEVKEHYYIFADHIYMRDGSDEATPINANKIREYVENHYIYRGVYPVVFVDYLQILAPVNERYTDKQNADQTITTLKRISRDYKIPVIAISSFNRSGYKDGKTEDIGLESLKESGGIEYGADVVLAYGKADKNTQESYKNNIPRRTVIRILKNRNGLSGSEAKLDAYLWYSLFTDTPRY